MDEPFSSKHIPLVLTGTCSFLSMLGGLGIVITYMSIPELQTYTRRLLVYLTVADIMTAGGYFLSVARFGIDADDAPPIISYKFNTTNQTLTYVDPVCTIQSFITTYSTIASFLWTLVIIVHVNLSVMGKTEHQTKPWILFVVSVLCWLIPGLVAVISAKAEVLGDNAELTGPWCWLTKEQGWFWTLFAGKGWELGAYLLCPVFFVWYKTRQYHYRSSHRRSFLEVSRRAREDQSKFAWILFMLYLLRIWGTIRVLIDVTDVTSQHWQNVSDVLLYFQSIGDPSQAFANFINLCVCDKWARSQISSAKAWNFCQHLRSRKIDDESDSDTIGVQQSLINRQK